MPLKRLTYLIILLLPLWVAAQQPVATAKLDTQEILIGDQIRLTLLFTGVPDAQVAWPVLQDTLTGKLDILDRTPVDTIRDASGVATGYRQQLLITSFDSGLYMIPSIPFYFRVLPDTTIYVTETTPRYLMVHTVAVDTNQPIKPIKGPMGAPVTFRDVLPWILIGVLVLSLTAFVIYFIRKRRKQEPIFRLRPRIQLKPHEKALKELEKLRTRKLWQKGELKAYYTALTDILRIYIEERFQVPAMESTSAEILQALAEPPDISRETTETLGKILMLADMVKFAKEIPLPDANEASLDRATEFIQQTTLIETQQEKGMRDT